MLLQNLCTSQAFPFYCNVDIKLRLDLRHHLESHSETNSIFFDSMRSKIKGQITTETLETIESEYKF